MIKQLTLSEINARTPAEDPDWMFKPILHTNTRTNYDSSGIEQEYIEEYEAMRE